MKLRDILNTQEGYLEILELKKQFVNKKIEKIKELIEDERNGVQRHPKSNNDVINSTRNTILMYQQSIFETNYSIGENVLKIKQDYLKLTKYFQESWQSHWGYVQMVEVLSIGIMLEIEDNEFDKLAALVERDKVKDYLIDFLIKYRKPNWQQTEIFLWNKPYKSIANIVELSKENKEKVLERLQKYLKEWYRGLETKTHESKWNIHTGYWSWEAGAITKILGLDDSSLKDQQYYPYDMVHFKDEQS